MDGGARATADSAVGYRKVKVSCKYRQTCVGVTRVTDGGVPIVPANSGILGRCEVR